MKEPSSEIELLVWWLSKYYFVEERDGDPCVIEMSTHDIMPSGSLLRELSDIFSLDGDIVKTVVQSWATFIDKRNDLSEYWKRIWILGNFNDAYVYAPHMAMQHTERLSREIMGVPEIYMGVDPANGHTSVMSRYSNRVVNPDYYSTIRID